MYLLQSLPAASIASVCFFSLRMTASRFDLRSLALQQSGKEGYRICRRVPCGRRIGGDVLVARARIVEMVGCVRVNLERYVSALCKALIDEILAFLRINLAVGSIDKDPNRRIGQQSERRGRSCGKPKRHPAKQREP
jgi:hypothetical protein